MDKFEKTGTRRLEFVNFNKNEGKIYLPNEIFRDLQKAMPKANGKQLSFAYSYYYLITYFWRYAKYGVSKFTTKDLKEILCYASTSKTVDFIIKKGGILDQMGYTSVSKDYPISQWTENKFPIFTMNSELGEEVKSNERNYSVKFPVKAYYRTEESLIENVTDGTFYDSDYTHGIFTGDFLWIMDYHNLETIGFYVYGYLVSRICFHGGRYYNSVSKIARNLGISERTVSECTNWLEHYNFIVVERQDYKNNPEKLANVYTLPINY